MLPSLAKICPEQQHEMAGNTQQQQRREIAGQKQQSQGPCDGHGVGSRGPRQLQHSPKHRTQQQQQIMAQCQQVVQQNRQHKQGVSPVKMSYHQVMGLQIMKRRTINYNKVETWGGDGLGKSTTVRPPSPPASPPMPRLPSMDGLITFTTNW